MDRIFYNIRIEGIAESSEIMMGIIHQIIFVLHGTQTFQSCLRFPDPFFFPSRLRNRQIIVAVAGISKQQRLRLVIQKYHLAKCMSRTVICRHSPVSKLKHLPIRKRKLLRCLRPWPHILIQIIVVMFIRPVGNDLRIALTEIHSRKCIPAIPVHIRRVNIDGVEESGSTNMVAMVMGRHNIIRFICDFVLYNPSEIPDSGSTVYHQRPRASDNHKHAHTVKFINLVNSICKLIIR